MKRPAFQFYPADWRNNAKLRRCSHAARGAWIDLLCLFHDSDEYGILRWPLADISQAAGVPMALLLELSRKDVLKGADSGCDALVFRPVHGRTKGEAVTLIASSDAPCWYSSRMVVDEYKRGRMGATTRYQASPSHAPSHSPSIAPSHRQGDGSTSSSSSSSTKQDQKPLSVSATPKADVPAEAILVAFRELLPSFPQPRKLDGDRRKKIIARWHEDPERQTLDWWRDYFGYVAKSDFLTGRDGKWQSCNLDWLLEPKNMRKVTEGNYENRGNA